MMLRTNCLSMDLLTPTRGEQVDNAKRHQSLYFDDETVVFLVRPLIRCCDDILARFTPSFAG